MSLLSQLIYEMEQLVQDARHLPEQRWREFVSRTSHALSQRKPHKTEFWMVQSGGDSLDYWGPWASEAEAREAMSGLGGEVIEIEASGTPASIGAARRRREARDGAA